MQIPKDPFILLSYINTKLRDEYSSLEDLCDSLDIDQKQLEDTLGSLGYAYSKDNNSFVPY
ncbi:MAG TPA: DUF4250 domain-containing protein [Clostridiales bacterium]|jgi:hypothetical protein|nr:DUF4250 domain-containing protein [Clostridiales bacterium]